MPPAPNPNKIWIRSMSTRGGLGNHWIFYTSTFWPTFKSTHISVYQKEKGGLLKDAAEHLIEMHAFIMKHEKGSIKHLQNGGLLKI